MTPPTLYLDLDGVLADFVAGAARVHGRDPASVRRWNFFGDWGLTPDKFWAPLDRVFWATLPKTPECDDLVRVATDIFGVENIALVSSPCKNDGCDDGKRAWVATHLPQFEDALFLGRDKARLAHPAAVLLDDCDDNVSRFVARGGNAITMPRPWNKNAFMVPAVTVDDLRLALGIMRSALEAVACR